MTLKTVEIAVTKIAARRMETGDQLSAIIRRGLRLKKGRALKTYAPKIAGKVTQRLYARIKAHGYPLKVSYKGNFVFIVKAKKPKVATPKAAENHQGATV